MKETLVAGINLSLSKFAASCTGNDHDQQPKRELLCCGHVFVSVKGHCKNVQETAHGTVVEPKGPADRSSSQEKAPAYTGAFFFRCG
ncbi:MAG: hypothetical protein AAFN63_08605 [Pseudomonadota bacterium]